jgi:hypothetical protein
MDSFAVPPARRSILVGTVSCSVNGLSAGVLTGSGQMASVLAEAPVMPAIPVMPGMPAIEAVPPLTAVPAEAASGSSPEPTVMARTVLPATDAIPTAFHTEAAPGRKLLLTVVLLSLCMTAPRLDVGP